MRFWTYELHMRVCRCARISNCVSKYLTELVEMIKFFKLFEIKCGRYITTKNQDRVNVSIR